MKGASQAGFTLVEMLVALAALALLATGGVMLTGFATGASERVRDRQTETVDLLRLHASLSSDLGQAAARRARDETGRKPQAALAGRAVTRNGVFLQLVRRGWDNPLGESRASLQTVEYRLSEGRLERIWRRHVDGSPAEAPQVLLEGVRSVHIGYYDYDQWTENWTGAPNRPLPRAVRLDIEIEGRGAVTQSFLLPEALT